MLPKNGRKHSKNCARGGAGQGGRIPPEHRVDVAVQRRERLPVPRPRFTEKVLVPCARHVRPETVPIIVPLRYLT